MKSKWIDHQGQRIFYIDLSNFLYDQRGFDNELATTVSTIGQEIYSMPLSSALVIVDLRNTFLTRQVQRQISERITDTKKFIRKTAVIGLSGIRGIFLDYFARIAGAATQGFDDPEAAKNWLVQ